MVNHCFPNCFSVLFLCFFPLFFIGGFPHFLVADMFVRVEIPGTLYEVTPQFIQCDLNCKCAEVFSIYQDICLFKAFYWFLLSFVIFFLALLWVSCGF